MMISRGNRKKGFSKQESIDLLKSLLAIGTAFAIAFTGARIFSLDFLGVLLISLATVGLGFLLHELMHKYFAQKYGAVAEYRSDDKMLLLTLAISFLGVVFAAPGAVMMHGRLSRKELGIVSASGPATNLALAAAFLVLGLFAGAGILQTVSAVGAGVNSWIALFNLIPAWQFDGKKIFAWNRAVWGALGAAAVLFLIIVWF